MLILLESATDNIFREFFEYHEDSLILDWRDFSVVLFSGWFCLLNAVFIVYRI